MNAIIYLQLLITLGNNLSFAIRAITRRNNTQTSIALQFVDKQVYIVNVTR